MGHLERNKITQPIGEDCKCIYKFEQFYVDIALKELIGQEEKTIKELIEKERRGELPKPYGFEDFDLFSRSKGIHERYVRDLKIVKERFAAMPTCEE